MKKITKKISIAIALLAIVIPLSLAHAETLADTFTKMAKDSKLPLSKEVFCVADEDGYITGYNDSDTTRVIPASVSKLYTFDFALDALGKDFRYTTDIILYNNTLYINGGGDPHIVTENVVAFIKKANGKNTSMITNIVISPNFYLNWKNKEEDLKAEFKKIITSNKSLPLASDVTIKFSTSPYKGRGTRYQFKSAPLPVLMKQMSNWSTNITTDVLFVKAGGSKVFSKYMKDTYNASSSIVKFGTGSGLSNNYTSCKLTLDVIKHLEEQASELDIGIYNIMTVPRIDPGVLRDSFTLIPNTGALLIKSGTLNYHHNYAGIAYTDKGPMYFAVFSGYDSLKDSTRSKDFSQKFVAAFTRTLKLKSISYKPSIDVIGESTITKVKK